MTRGQVKRRLSFNWWQYLALALLPLFVINLVFGRAEALLPVLAMPFFIAGVASPPPRCFSACASLTAINTR